VAEYDVRMAETTRSPLRQFAHDAARRKIAETAVDLFAERGFAKVTVGDIVQEAGTSARTFHRHFASKEDTVLIDAAAHGELVRTELERCEDPDPWSALRQALRPLAQLTESDGGRALRAMGVLLSTDSLRARSVQKHQQWTQFLIPALRTGRKLDETQARALVLSALACFDAALEEWTAHGGERPLEDLLDQAFRAVGYR
jgi:AcrR family transcriptional regulator